MKSVPRKQAQGKQTGVSPRPVPTRSYVPLTDEEQKGAEMVAMLNRCEYPPLDSIREVRHANREQ